MPQAAELCLSRCFEGSMQLRPSTKHNDCAKQPVSGCDIADHLHILSKILLLK